LKANTARIVPDRLEALPQCILVGFPVTAVVKVALVGLLVVVVVEGLLVLLGGLGGGSGI